MPSKEVYSRFLANGLELAGSNYNRLDTLESNDDLASLFDVLSAFKDHSGNHPVITANFVVGNPDFNRIRESDFSSYFYEPVTETLKKYPGRDLVQSLWGMGMAEKIFHPQFHGREHVNITRWMDALRKRSPKMMLTFDNETTFSGNDDYNFMEVLDFNSPADLENMKVSLTEGMDLFNTLFGYRSLSFIPPCYTWSNAVEETLHKGGVKYIQGLIIQQIPTGKFGNYKKRYHFLGSRNVFGQTYLIRNCFFEPSLSGRIDEVEQCLKRIATAFRWNKPAIISTHRVNYMGALEESNRIRTLGMLRRLLKEIFRKWPEVEFMTSDRLGNLITKEY